MKLLNLIKGIYEKCHTRCKRLNAFPFGPNNKIGKPRLRISIPPVPKLPASTIRVEKEINASRLKRKQNDFIFRQNINT